MSAPMNETKRSVYNGTISLRQLQCTFNVIHYADRKKFFKN